MYLEPWQSHLDHDKAQMILCHSLGAYDYHGHKGKCSYQLPRACPDHQALAPPQKPFLNNCSLFFTVPQFYYSISCTPCSQPCNHMQSSVAKPKKKGKFFQTYTTLPLYTSASTLAYPLQSTSTPADCSSLPPRQPICSSLLPRQPICSNIPPHRPI